MHILSSIQQLRNDFFFFQAEDGIRDRDGWLEFRRVLFRSQDLVAQIQFFEAQNRFEEAKRIKERTEMDLEMLRELGYCSGVEN